MTSSVFEQTLEYLLNETRYLKKETPFSFSFKGLSNRHKLKHFACTLKVNRRFSFRLFKMFLKADFKQW